MPPDERLDGVERLDALLVPLHVPELAPSWQPGDEALEPLLAVARALRPLRMAVPSAAFTRSLEARLLTADALLAAAATENAPTVESVAPEQLTSVAVGRHNTARRTRRMRPARPVRFLWPAVAAVLLLAAGTLTAAAAAGPGSLLYALHRLEQTARVALAATPAERVQLHLQYASNALTAADSAARSGDAGSYNDALSTLVNEMGTAGTDLRSVPAGSEYNRLAGSLASLRARAIADLRSNLPSLSWSQRLNTTDALAAFADRVPRVTSATATRLHDAGSTISANGANGSTHTWRVQLSGTNFAPGARLLVNGQPAGTVLSVTETAMIATYTAPDGQPPTALGVANPDETAAQTTRLTFDTHDEMSTTATPGSDGQSGDHGGSGTGGHGGQGGGRGGTPTPSPRGG